MTAGVPLGSVCSGYGGLEMGISRVIPGARPVWQADYEPPTEKIPRPKNGPSIILAHRYPGVPNLGDITAVHWPSTVPARIVCGGTPCQDVSAAGARAGMRAGTRSGIWSSMVEAIAYHRPTLVVWENVRGALSAGADSGVESCPICLGDERECNLRALGRVLGDFSELRYDAVWKVVPASAVGAPHQRERVFVAAWPADPDRFGHDRGRPGAEENGGGEPPNAGGDAANAEGYGRDEGWTESAGVERGPDVAVGGAVNWGVYGAAVARWERFLGRAAPAPTETSPRGGAVLSPVFVEWMMGLPAGWVTAVPGLTRADQLKALGNGVVPQQAAGALGELLGFAPGWVRADLNIG